MRPSAGLITEYETTCSWPLCYASLSWFYHVVGLTNVWWQMMSKTNFGPTFFPGGGTLGISGWGCAAGTLEPLTYTRASSAEFCYPILE